MPRTGSCGTLWKRRRSHICPRSCPSENATLCTYVYARWFARPAGFQPCAPPAAAFECWLHACAAAFSDGDAFCAQCPGQALWYPTDQRLCQHCTLHAAHDERHLLLECPAMQTVRDHYPALFSPAQGSMHLFRLVLWGSHISSWIVLTTLGQRRVLMMMVTRTQAHLHQPWRLYRRKEDYICSSRPGLIRWNIDIVIRPTHLAWQTIP